MTKTVTNRPLVSVIMPVYNTRDFVTEAIESIRNQTLKNWKLLIIDDHSTDGSWDIIQDFAQKDQRIHIFRNRQNRGLVRSLNTLIPKTTGTYVARMDSDDISLPDRLEKQVAFLEKHPSIVACGGQEYIINEHGVAVAEKHFPTDPTACYRMIMNMMVIQPPVLMARGTIFRTLLYDNHIFKNDDISMHFKLLEHGGFSNVNDIIFKYRKRMDSITNKDPKRAYFLALMVRINAILNHNFRPPVLNTILAILESVLVGILPNQAIIGLFEMLRFSNNATRQFQTTSLTTTLPNIGYTKK